MTELGPKIDFIIAVVKNIFAAVTEFSLEAENLHPW